MIHFLSGGVQTIQPTIPRTNPNVTTRVFQQGFNGRGVKDTCSILAVSSMKVCLCIESGTNRYRANQALSYLETGCRLVVALALGMMIYSIARVFLLNTLKPLSVPIHSRLSYLR
jgi:hypothetical protein